MASKTGPQAGPDMQTVVTTHTQQAREHRAALVGSVALVPTMGALHDGHIEHIRVCRGLADHVLVSVFVNPTQFGPGEDFERYPRALEADIQRCAQAGAAGVFTPSVDELYPPTRAGVVIDVPSLTADLEGRHRPDHFQGVCRVVAKLLNIFRPDFVSFGRKDYQQLRVVQTMVRDLMIPTRVVEVPTVREADGLAMSSRNLRLDTGQRQRALGMYKALLCARRLVEQDGETDSRAVEKAMHAVLEAHHVEVDYTAVRHPQTLTEPACIEPALSDGVIALVAGSVGPVRLIDNMLLGGS
jgi:pantoate--beta-alanine ligase